MAKKSMIAREQKRQATVHKFAHTRSKLKHALQVETNPAARAKLVQKLQGLPRNSAAVRLHHRCALTGRPKGFFRAFGLSRHVLREMAHEGLLPGVTKASW